jgi:formylglycine-generating enzyme required for sulfatase activity
MLKTVAQTAVKKSAAAEKSPGPRGRSSGPSNDLPSEQAHFNGAFPFGKASKGKYLGRTTRVGAYPPNTPALCDMHGNVSRWCADLFAPKVGSSRVARGGGRNGFGFFCRAADTTESTSQQPFG